MMLNPKVNGPKIWGTFPLDVAKILTPHTETCLQADHKSIRSIIINRIFGTGIALIQNRATTTLGGKL